MPLICVETLEPCSVDIMLELNPGLMYAGHLSMPEC